MTRVRQVCAVYSKHQGTLRMVAQLRSEFERSAPYATFGAPVEPSLCPLVSRNARHFPAMKGWFYGNVFGKEAAGEATHLERIPDSLGFIYWWAGKARQLIGLFTVSQVTEVNARSIGGSWTDSEIEWFVAGVAGAKLAEGRGREARFNVQAGREYYFRALLSKHPGQDSWALCLDHARE